MIWVTNQWLRTCTCTKFDWSPLFAQKLCNLFWFVYWFEFQFWHSDLVKEIVFNSKFNKNNQHFPFLNSTLEKWENERNEKKVVDLAAVHTEGDSTLLTMAQ